MTLLERFVRFWWDFVVGDDWRLAVGALAAVGLTALLTSTGVTAWWLLPPSVAALLYVVRVVVQERRPLALRVWAPRTPDELPPEGVAIQ